MATKLIINTERQGYSTEQITRTITVGELISFLEDYEPDTEVYLSFDNGYTYGGIQQHNLEEVYEEDYGD